MQLERVHEGGLSLRRRVGGGPRVLYIHGLGESGLCFESIMTDDRLSGWTHLCPDMRGYGTSPRSDEPLTLERQADELARWIDGAAAGPVAVIGHSMGGVIGTMLCERRPDLVRGLLDVEGNISSDDCTYSGPAAAMDRGAFVEHGMAALLEQLYRAGADEAVVRDYFASVRICDPRAFHENAVELVQLSGSGELAPRLAALPRPGRYLLGHPRGTGPGSRAQLEAAGVGWQAIDDAGHWPFADQPDAFVEAALAFVEALP